MGLMVSLAVVVMAQTSFQAETRQWRQDYEKRLVREEGWVNVAGLLWLKEGENSIGSHESSDIVLPAHACPPHAGFITLNKGGISIALDEGVEASINGTKAWSSPLLSDIDEGGPDKVRIGSLLFKIIKRGKRWGIRLYDSESPGAKAFKGVSWFPADPMMKVKAKFVAYPKPKQLMITNIIGDTEPVANPGYAEFTLGGKKLRLEAVDEGETYFFNFKDGTNGTTTYSAGRFLDAPKPKNGVIELDFNRTYNPPCAWTDFATCPLPPKQNFLPISIKAGAKFAGHH